jgi:hypothetical protein
MRRYGPWFTTLKNNDHVAIIGSGRMFRLDWWKGAQGQHFARVWEAWSACFHAHHPARILFAQDVQPGSLKRFKAVLVVGQTIEFEPNVLQALPDAKAAEIEIPKVKGKIVYDVMAMKAVQAENFQCDLRTLPARLYAILPGPIKEVRLDTPKKVNPGETFRWKGERRTVLLALLDAQHFVVVDKGKAPAHHALTGKPAWESAWNDPGPILRVACSPDGRLCASATDTNGEPWLPWHDWTGWYNEPHNIELDTYRTQLRLTGLTFFEDPAHPESRLRDATVEYWNATKQRWVFLMNLLSDAPVHTHQFPKPVEAARFRIVLPVHWPGNIRLAEIVMHGEALGSSHPDVIAERPLAVLFDEGDDLTFALAGFDGSWRFQFEGRMSADAAFG